MRYMRVVTSELASDQANPSQVPICAGAFS